MGSDCLVRIRQALPNLRPAEAKVAAAVLADPAAVVSKTITELVAFVGTSQATIVRFCHSLGYTGYPAFRIDLAQATSRLALEMEQSTVAHGEIDPDDSVEDIVQKIAFHEARTIEATARSLDLTVLDNVAQAISRASRIDIFGLGSSGLAAQDLAQKLQRIGLVCFASPDVHVQLQSAALLGPGAVALAISHSGLTVETNDALQTAKSGGATTVVVTNFPHAPLAEHADMVLTTAAHETRFRSGALSSRIAQLAIIDFLFVRVAQRLYDRTTNNLRATFDAVQSHRLGQDRDPEP